MPSHRKLKILYYNLYFKQPLSEERGFLPTLVEDLCTITEDRTQLTDADVVLFHIPNVRELPSKRPGQIWVALSLESDANYALQRNLTVMRNFDLHMNFRSNADIQMPYFDWECDLPLLQSPPRPKHRQAPAVYFASNDYAPNNRYELVEDLMKYMRIDSYGKSQNNCKLENDTGRMTKLDIISGYHFNLAFENSNCVDYVTEKVFDGLIAGSVPVYFGAPNVDQFLPGEKCIIKATDFSTAAALAKFLLALKDDQAEYESYLAWKNKPLLEGFTTWIQLGSTSPIRRLCYKLIELQAARESTVPVSGNDFAKPDS